MSVISIVSRPFFVHTSYKRAFTFIAFTAFRKKNSLCVIMADILIFETSDKREIEEKIIIKSIYSMISG